MMNPIWFCTLPPQRVEGNIQSRLLSFCPLLKRFLAVDCAAGALAVGSLRAGWGFQCWGKVAWSKSLETSAYHSLGFHSLRVNVCNNYLVCWNCKGRLEVDKVLDSRYLISTVCIISGVERSDLWEMSC